MHVLFGGVDDAFTIRPLCVERFDTARAARTAVGSPGDGGESGDDAVVSTEGTESFAGREWMRVFYDLDGTTVYAYRTREGATIVTTLPSDVPWGERGSWTVGLDHTRIAATAPEG